MKKLLVVCDVCSKEIIDPSNSNWVSIKLSQSEAMDMAKNWQYIKITTCNHSAEG